MKIGVMFGSPETTTGGNALKFYATNQQNDGYESEAPKSVEQLGQGSATPKYSKTQNLKSLYTPAHPVFIVTA